MNIIMFLIVMEMGLIPSGHLKMYEGDVNIRTKMSFHIDTQVEMQLVNNHIFIGGGTKIYFWKTSDDKTFSPDIAGFTFNAGFRYKFAEIGYRHFCEHPIIPWINSIDLKMNYERSFDEIYVKITGKIGGKK